MTDDDEVLVKNFKRGPLSDWILEEILNDKLMRFAQAYLRMARALSHRPAAPRDLPLEELNDKDRLYREAVSYAMEFSRAEESGNLSLGISCHATARAFVFVIEAAQLLARGNFWDKYAEEMLRLALHEMVGRNSKAWDEERKQAGKT
jgi:hypothetical protein